MKRSFTHKRVVLLLVTSILLCLSEPTHARELGLKTGAKGGTYYQFGRDLSLLCKGYGLIINVMTSEGSVENLISVLTDENVQLAIVQHDVLAFIELKHEQKPSEKAYKSVRERLRSIYPLYDEEVHILGRKTISSFEQLKGKRLAVGFPGSGTLLTSKLMLASTGVKPAERIEIGSKRALDALVKGDIDAMVYVAGQPVELFKEFMNPGGFHLIPVTHRKIIDFYDRSIIPEKTYPWQLRDIRTVSVKGTLVTLDYKGKACKDVRKFAKIISDNIEWLRRYGHPKWKSVDLDFDLGLWKKSPCVR